MSNRGNLYPISAGDSPAPQGRATIGASGTMAELVRSHNWADTPLGPIDTWSETLLTSVSTILHSAFPMAVCWGPEMIELYNDAYLSVIAERHPAALGAPVREVWKEAWQVIGPRFEDAMTRGHASWEENALIPVMHG